MGRQKIAMRPAAADAARVLGQQVRLSRHERNWTAAELAQRAGVSARTVAEVENGSATVSVGNALNIAATVGLPLFGETKAEGLANERRIRDDKLALLPSRVYHRTSRDADVSLDF
jgi:transcriptional regulator with XRE-family HTH domain